MLNGFPSEPFRYPPAAILPAQELSNSFLHSGNFPVSLRRFCLAPLRKPRKDKSCARLRALFLSSVL